MHPLWIHQEQASRLRRPEANHGQCMMIWLTLVVLHIFVLNNRIVDIAAQPQFIPRNGGERFGPHLLEQVSSLGGWQCPSSESRQSLPMRAVWHRGSCVNLVHTIIKFPVKRLKGGDLTTYIHVNACIDLRYSECKSAIYPQLAPWLTLLISRAQK